MANIPPGAVLTWGPLALVVTTDQIATFTDFTRKASYKTETKDNGTNKPRTVNKGPELQTASIKVELAAQLGVNVNAAVDGWIGASEAGSANELFIGGVKLGANKWQVRDVSVSNMEFAKDIRTLAGATLQISFVEYATANAKKPAPKKKTSTTKAPVTTVPPSKTETKITQWYKENVAKAFMK